MALTPMMQQYLQVKEKCPDCILFFRLGDFYEMFFEDAETASRELELVLTGRDCGLEQRAPMCGIPYHAANNYISRLVSKGYKIAICEQLEDPSVAKGIVQRDIIKIITPGTFIDSSFIEESKNNFIMSLYIRNDLSNCGLCFADISTGEFFSTSFALSMSVLINEISKYCPRECLVQEDIDEATLEQLKDRFPITYTRFKNSNFILNAQENVSKQFADIDVKKLDESLIYAAHGVLNYILETQKLELSNLGSLEYYSILDYMSLDINTRRNLELTETIREKTKKGSLLWVLDKTSTAMGGRLLRRWIEQPLINSTMIEERLDAVENIVSNLSLLEDIKLALKGVYDIERIVGKISSKSVNAKELISLKLSVQRLPAIKMLLSNTDSCLLQSMYNNLDELSDIFKVIDDSILDSPPLTIKEGNIIKDNFNSEVDELRKAKTHGREWIASLENNEREITGIRSLKVGYNKVFGYYIEISRANYSSIPEGRYIRKQTLANAERFITQELKEMEDKILGAEEKLISIEYELFIKIREIIESHIERMQNSARILAELDCLCSLATASLENNFVKPSINSEGYIKIDGGRHPVVEKVIPLGTFVSNDTFINTDDSQLLLITGPNMAGKSTYMRQVALIAIMAQMGSFVPAKSADISICDKLFTRIGASDDLSSGKSTFMVEMWEVANIINNATKNSLVLLDEVGRGTSTYDGLSIAWSVIEFICSKQKLKCKTLFATHYHELTKLEGIIDGVKNYSVSVKEVGNEVIFLRKIIRGGADQSYGIEVAKLAGLPKELIERAKEILSRLEKDTKDDLNTEIAVTVKENHERDTEDNISSESHTKSIIKKPASKKDSISSSNMIQVDFTEIEKNALIKEVASLDIMSMTPIDCMTKLYEMIKKAKAL